MPDYIRYAPPVGELDPQGLPATPFPLRHYQHDALTAITVADLRGVRRQVVSLPTGSGKTVIFAHMLQAHHGRALVLVHRDELITQTIDKLTMVSRGSGLTLGVIKGAKDEQAGDVVIASVQTLQREQRLRRVTQGFDLIVVDECHHALRENSYGRILDYFGAFGPQGPLTTGFTATPFRPNNDPIITTPTKPACFDEVVFSLPLMGLIAQGFLSPLIAQGIQLEGFDLDTIAIREGDYVPSELSRALLAAETPRHLVRGYEEFALGRRALIFCPTIKMANAVETAFSMGGFRAATVVGSTPLEERRQRYHEIKMGVLDVLVTCAVLTEGFDEPSIDCIVLARPTRSKVLFFQCIGRGVRKWPTKENCLLVDVAGATQRHGLLSVAAELGLLKPKEAPGEDERDPHAEKVPDEPPDTLYRAYGINLAQREPLHWVQTPKGYWVVNLADRLLRVRPDDHGTYLLEIRKRDERGFTRMVERLTQEWCFGMASDTARDAELLDMVRAGAPWRLKAPSARQLEAARKLGVRVDPSWTSGQVSDAMTLATADWYD